MRPTLWVWLCLLCFILAGVFSIIDWRVDCLIWDSFQLFVGAARRLVGGLFEYMCIDHPNIKLVSLSDWSSDRVGDRVSEWVSEWVIVSIQVMLCFRWTCLNIPEAVTCGTWPSRASSPPKSSCWCCSWAGSRWVWVVACETIEWCLWVMR